MAHDPRRLVERVCQAADQLSQAATSQSLRDVALELGDLSSSLESMREQEVVADRRNDVTPILLSLTTVAAHVTSHAVARIEVELASVRAILARRTAELAALPPPNPPPSVPRSELLRLCRECPEAVAEIKAVVARQDLTEAQKMAEIQRITRQH